MTYIGRIQGMAAFWLVLRPIFEMCTRDKGYWGEDAGGMHGGIRGGGDIY